MEIADRGGIVVNDFARFIRKLNDEGILLKRGKQLYKFVEDWSWIQNNRLYKVIILLINCRSARKTS